MVIKLVTFTGNNGAGTISVPGVKVGDKVLSVLVTDTSNFGSEIGGNFIKFILQDDELPQLGTGNLSSVTFTAMLERNIII